MPHQCVKCSALYGDDAPEVMSGCACGSQAFFFLRALPRLDETIPPPTATIITEEITIDTSHDVKLLDGESVNIVSECKYELDLHALFGKDTVVYKEEDGKYRVDLEATFRKGVK